MMGVVAAGERPLVGHAGAIFPVELAAAAGCDLCELDPSGGDADRPLVKQWIDDKEGELIRRLIAVAIARGAGSDALHGMVVMRTFEQAYYYLRELQRLGAAELPMLHMFDLISSSGPSFRIYNRRQVSDLLDLLARIGHSRPDAGALRQAIVAGNERRKRLRVLNEARRAGKITGAAAVESILRGTVPPEPTPALRAGPRLLVVSSEPIFSAATHSAVEQAGFQIVAEEDGSGRFYPPPDIDPRADPLDAIAAHYSAIPTARSQVQDERLAFVRTTLSRGVDVVLCLIAAHDQQLGWDVPTLRRETEESGARFVTARSGSPEHALAALGEGA